MSSRLKVFYTEAMVAVFPTDSPGPRKPALVVQDWKEHGLAIEIAAPAPVTKADYLLAHESEFVEEIFAGETDNGFFNRDERVLKSLPYTTGAMFDAAVHAIHAQTFACAPVSGFHHAKYNEIGVYCTFNGLVVTAQKLKKANLARKVGILDYDMHYGDGTDDIRLRLGLDWITHYTAGREFRRAEQAALFFRRIPEHLERMEDCQVILYQAGADPHRSDPLGGWLTTEQLRERDRIVFETARRLNLPIAWNLAGGYQEEPDGSIPNVLEIHRNTALECLAHL